MDLEFLAAVIDEWPDPRLDTVRLDSDGEICFEPVNDFDFYPDDLTTAHAVFDPCAQCRQRGCDYTKEQWEQARASHHD